MLFRSDRKSTRLNSSHLVISYAVFCLKKKKKTIRASLLGVDAPSWDGPSPQPGAANSHPDPTPRPPSRQFTTTAETLLFFFFNDTATPEIYTLSLHDALPI